MSDRITLSPTSSPLTISTVFTDERPSCTCTRDASFAVIHHFKQAHGAVRFAVNRPADEQDVGQALDFHGTFHAQVRTRTGRQRAVQTDVDGYGSVLYGGSMRVTWPGMIPLWVSIEAFCPITMSFA